MILGDYDLGRRNSMWLRRAVSAVLLIVATDLAGACPAQQITDPYEVLNRYFKACGGLERLKAERTQYFEGALSLGEMRGTVKVWTERPDRSRVEVELGLFGVTEGHNGEVSWVLGANGKLQKITKSDEVTLKRREVERRMAEYEYADSGSDIFTVTLEGTEKVGETDCYVIKVTSTINADYHTYYIGVDGFLLEKGVAIKGEESADEYYADYRNIDGIMVPFYTQKILHQTGRAHEVTVTHYDSNPRVDRMLFDPPEGSNEDHESSTGNAADNPGLPKPTGPHALGTTHLVFVDETRPELFTDDPADHREITVRAWYPGDPTREARTAPYYENGEEIVTRFGYPSALLDLDTHSKLGIPVSRQEGMYPVVLFNHGWGEHAVQNTALMEELASHGYVVFSLAHHYEAKYWVYPDGRLGFLDSESPRFQRIIGEQSKPGMMELFQAMFSTRGVAAQESLFKKTVAAMPTFLGESPRMWAEDIKFIIDQLDSLHRSQKRFGGKLDLERIGVMGMSMGGIAAGQACIIDSRIKAAINVDGGPFGDLADTVVAQPMMYMSSKRFIGYDQVFADHAGGDVYTLTIGAADHYDFSDFTLLNREHPMIGTVEGLRMLKILNSYTLAFFDFYLRGKESDLLRGERKPYPEVDFRAHKGP
jgi:pimeloyl-ACP methyl ester carboxylesterase